MFASEYAKDDENVVGTIVKSVVSSGGESDHVVAPGTKGELLNATITGKPEVAVKVSYEPTLTLNGWEYTDEGSASSEYFPIIFKDGECNIQWAKFHRTYMNFSRKVLSPVKIIMD